MRAVGLIARLYVFMQSLRAFSLFPRSWSPVTTRLSTILERTDQDTANTVLLRLEQIRGNVPTETEFKAAGSPKQGQNITTESGTQVPITTQYIACGKSGGSCKATTGAYSRPMGRLYFVQLFSQGILQPGQVTLSMN